MVFSLVVEAGACEADSSGGGRWVHVVMPGGWLCTHHQGQQRWNGGGRGANYPHSPACPSAVCRRASDGNELLHVPLEAQVLQMVLEDLDKMS